MKTNPFFLVHQLWVTSRSIAYPVRQFALSSRVERSVTFARKRSELGLSASIIPLHPSTIPSMVAMLSFSRYYSSQMSVPLESKGGRSWKKGVAAVGAGMFVAGGWLWENRKEIKSAGNWLWENREEITKVWRDRNIFSLGEFQEKIYESTENDSALIKALDNPLAEQLRVKRVAIIGESGRGKTWLARHYAFQYYQKHSKLMGCIVYELNAEHTGTLESSYRDFASRLGISEAHSLPCEVLQKKVAERLEQKPQQFLLIFDNAEDDKQVEPYIPHTIASKGIVLITTQKNYFLPLGSGFNFDILKPTPGQAMELFQREVYPSVKIDSVQAQALLKYLDYHPRSIVEAAAYLNENPHTNPEGYQKNIQEWVDHYNKTSAPLTMTALEQRSLAAHVLALRRFLILPELKADAIPNIISTTITPKKQLALEILNVCTYLYPEGISFELMQKYFGQFHRDILRSLASPEVQKKLPSEPLTARQIIEFMEQVKPYSEGILKELHNRSFFRRIEEKGMDVYTLHRSTQLRHRHCLVENISYWKPRYYDASRMALGMATDPQSYYWWQASEMILTPLDSRSKKDLMEHIRLIPHVEALLTHREGLPNSPALLYNGFYLFNWLGHKLMQAGQYTKARSYLDRALHTWETRLPAISAKGTLEERAQQILQTYGLPLSALYADTLRYVGRLPEFTLTDFDISEDRLRLSDAIYDQMIKKETSSKELDRLALNKVLCYDDLGYVLLEAGAEQKQEKQVDKQKEAKHIFEVLLMNEKVKKEPFRQYKCHTRLANYHLSKKDMIMQDSNYY